jgi:hypothetical protein
MSPKKQTFALVPIPKKIHLFQSFKKNLILHSSPQKDPFGKEK